jgi:Ca-activated chloride channel family protein
MSDMEKKLKHLKSLETPAPSSDAKKRAAALAMAAFDESAEKTANGSQGLSWGQRLMSIVTPLKGIRLMDIRIPATAAITALLIVPISWQLMNNTSLTPPTLGETIVAPTEQKDELVKGVVDGVISQQETENDLAAIVIPAPEMEAPMVSPNVSASSKVATRTMGAPAPMRDQLGYLQSGDKFESFDDANIKLTGDQPVSTFSIDVDTASYAYVRRAIENGRLPQKDAVRTEELINYFDYNYATPPSAELPFAPKISVYPAPWNAEHQLMHVAIKGYMPENVMAQPSNLVFLIDTSGSMNDTDKLPLLKRAFKLLVEQMDEQDTVSIVTYAGAAGVVLEPTSGADKRKILDALDNLTPGGSTAGTAGIETAYRLANEAKNNDGVNRVILATDGDFNVGISEPEALKDFIKQKRDKGISLSVLGFGEGNYNDALMQALAQNGDGNASYIDSYTEARKVLVNEVGGTLQTIARDVKIQVEFNPAQISAYRLIGYETRALNREDFNNDKVDAGDVGAGHTVTAIYELTPVGAAQPVDPLRYGETTQVDAASKSDELAFFKLRYKLPGADESTLIEMAVTNDNVVNDIADLSNEIQFGTSVAAFGQKLRSNAEIGTFGFDEISALAQASRGDDKFGYRAEFINLVEAAKSLAKN